MISLTTIILTKNEKLNIRDCIDSIKGFTKRIVVVDSFSNDETVDIAQELGADVYQNKFVNYATQFNWALDNTKIDTKWVLRLDADERFTPNLKKEIENIIKNDIKGTISGIVLNSWLYFLGKRLKFGASKKRKLMVFKYGLGRIEDRRMDEHTIVYSGEVVVAKNRYLHYDFKNIDVFIKKLNWYATREMQDYFEHLNIKTKKKLNDAKINKIRRLKFDLYYKFPKFLRTSFLFIYFYYLKLGFLDGKEGYIYNLLYTRFYRFIVDVKIFEQEKFQTEFEETGDLK